MTVAVATIGSYILENTHEEDELCQPPFKRPKSASNDPSRLPSLLCECVVAATNDTTIHTQPQQQCMTTRILLTQDESPGSRLVCSSLILDLALSLTSNCFCRCHRTRDIPIDNPEDRTPDGTREECHGCLAVVILKPFCGNPANATSNGDVFPMLCQRRYREWDPTPSTTGQEATAATTTTQSRCDRHGCSSSIQDSRTPAFATTCRRIQIRRVRSVQEVQRYLLSLLGLPRRDQPVGGILIDGFDQIVELGVEQEDLPATGVTEPAKTIRMTQAGSFVSFLQTKLPMCVSLLTESSQYSFRACTRF